MNKVYSYKVTTGTERKKELRRTRKFHYLRTADGPIFPLSSICCWMAQFSLPHLSSFSLLCDLASKAGRRTENDARSFLDDFSTPTTTKIKLRSRLGIFY
jgi:hypothetical protein